MSKLIYQYYSPTGLKKNKNLTNSSRLVIEEAQKQGLEWKIIPGTQLVSLTYQGQTRTYYHQVPSTTTALALYACDHKKTTSNLLKQAGLSVAHGYRIRRSSPKEYLKEIYHDLKKPLVVKPSDGTWGENITLNINNFDSYLAAVDLALKYSTRQNSGAIVEEMFEGKEYRILVTREKVIGVLNRVPANVIGDGQSSIEKLIRLKNKEEIRGTKGSDKSHRLIRIDRRLKKYLSEQGLDLKTVPQVGEQIFLRKVSNVSQGGDAIDITDYVHPSVKKLVLQAINAIPGLSWAGIDFMTTDITAQQNPNSYIIVEINSSPGFDIHDQPYKGKNRQAAFEFLKLMFPQLAFSTHTHQS